MEFNTDLPDNVRVENGCLVIEARKENYKGKTWTSGAINTNNLREFQYGRIEAKIKYPTDAGFWPAFWLMGANLNMIPREDGTIYNTGESWPECGELDIMEHVNAVTNSTGAIHYTTGNGLLSSAGYTSGTIDPKAWHVYAIEWTDTLIEWFTDGVSMGTFTMSSSNYGVSDNPFKQPQYILLNLAVGGAFPGNPESIS